MSSIPPSSVETSPRRARGRVTSLVAGTALALVALELGLRLVGLVWGAGHERRNQRDLDRGEVTILSLGESSTALFGDDAYPRQLEEVLNERTTPERFCVYNEGQPGVDSFVIILRLEEWLRRYDPDIVTVMMGINDAMEFFASLRQFEAEPETRRWYQRLKIFKLVMFLSLDIEDKRREQYEEETFTQEAERLLSRRNQTRPERWYMQYGSLYRRHGHYSEARDIYAEFASEYPCATAYFRLGRIYRDLSDEEGEEDWFRRAVAEFPYDHTAYRGILRMLRRQGKLAEAERILLQQAEAIPDVLSYLDLGNFYLGRIQLARAEEAFNESIAIEPTGYAWSRLGMTLEQMGRAADAEAAFVEAVAVDPCGEAHVELGRFLLRLGRKEEAAEAYLKAVDMGEGDWLFADYARHRRPPRYDTTHSELASYYRAEGRDDEAYALLDQIVSNQMTLDSYRTLTEAVLSRGSKLVVVQYPMRDASTLRLMVPPQQGVAFVDNEEDFQRAVGERGYNSVFTDAFAGDFGHCNRAGNRIIADNIADVILGEFF